MGRTKTSEDDAIKKTTSKKNTKKKEVILEDDNINSIEEIKDNDFNEEQIFTKKTKLNAYYSYGIRLSFFICMFLVFVTTASILFRRGLDFSEAKVLHYTEKSNIDYKVSLKANDFYEEKTLPKDKIYIASLIDKVNIDFNYLFNINDKVDIDFDYSIIGKLTINDTSGKEFYSKEYENYIEEILPEYPDYVIINEVKDS